METLDKATALVSALTVRAAPNRRRRIDKWPRIIAECPELVKAARDDFDNVQGKQRKYQPIIRPEDQPAITVNHESMERYRPALTKFYDDPTKYKTYLEQLGVAYPPQ